MSDNSQARSTGVDTCTSKMHSSPCYLLQSLSDGGFLRLCWTREPHSYQSSQSGVRFSSGGQQGIRLRQVGSWELLGVGWSERVLLSCGFDGHRKSFSKNKQKEHVARHCCIGSLNQKQGPPPKKIGSTADRGIPGGQSRRRDTTYGCVVNTRPAPVGFLRAFNA